MNSKEEEIYVFWSLAQRDLDVCLKSLRLARTHKDTEAAPAMIRDAVIAYCRPFTSNRGVINKKGLHLPPTLVPPDLKRMHERIRGYRDELFAHTSVRIRKPKLARLGRVFGFTMVAFHDKNLVNFVEPLSRLANAVLKGVRSHKKVLAKFLGETMPEDGLIDMFIKEKGIDQD